MLSVFGLFMIWFVIARLKVVPEFLIPTPTSVWEAFIEVAFHGYREGTLLHHLRDSLLRVIVGFLAGLCHRNSPRVGHGLQSAN